MHLHQLTAVRMDKAQFAGVQALTVQTGAVIARAVYRVAGNRMPQIGHMHADLVGAAGLQLTAHVSETGIPSDNFVMGHGRSAAGDHRHFLAVFGMAVDGRGNLAFILPQIADDNGLVSTGQAAVLQLIGQALMGTVVFRHDKQTAGVFIDAMHDTGAECTADAGQGAAAMIQQGVHQRTVGIAGCRMHHHTAGFVHHHHAGILINDVQRDILRHGLNGLGLGQAHLQHGAGCQLLVLFHRLVRKGHHPLLQQFLRGAAGQFGQSLADKAVGALGACIRRNFKTDDFHGHPPALLSPWRRFAAFRQRK